MSGPDINAVREYLLTLQDAICKEVENSDGKQKFAEDDWQRPAGGGGRTRGLNNGAV
ncbi:coproporphyrinogen III oxidase, partial [Methylophaga sp. UBA3191]|uniref:coproporphyrinogen III oxidase n=1 Tax=Methylophaga sp. UBA3191 TaxID=1946881 RepID=UPI0025E42D59